MSKKKHPVRQMTEVDYANYIMSLKDETPPKVIVNEDNDRLDKDE